MSDDLEKEFLEVLNKCKLGVEWFGKLPTGKQKLLYSYGRQGLYGDINTSKPNKYDTYKCYKWELHASLKGTPKAEAQRKFIEMAKEFYGEWLEYRPRL